MADTRDPNLLNLESDLNSMESAPQEEQQIQSNVLTEDNQQEEQQPEEQNQHEQQDNDNRKPTPQESWKELREKAKLADKLQKERDEYRQILETLEQEARKYNNQPQQPQEQEDDFDYNSLDDDDLMSGRDLKRVLTKEQKRLKKLEESIKSQQESAKLVSIENEIKSKFNDFYSVVNEDNVRKLREMRPGLARSLAYNPDVKEQAMETYQAIRDLGIYQEEVFNQDKQQAQRNASKPRAAQSVGSQSGSSPLSQANMFANGLTEEAKRSLYDQAKKKAQGW